MDKLPTDQSGHPFLNPPRLLHEAGLEPGQSVADLGCGAGYFILPAARTVGSRGVAYAVDVQQTALSSVRSRAAIYGLTNIQTVWSNVEQLGAARVVTDHSLDMVLLVQLLSQSKKHADIFREVDRIIKPGGKLVVVDWKPDAAGFGPARGLRVPLSTVEEMVRRHGFSAEQQLTASPYHYGVVYTKKR
ncbi:MAG: methyltransferase domain-containing protein [Patescibacteria group bacterium]